MVSRIFYLLSAFFVLLGAFIFFSPALITTDLIHPLRIDSSYVVFHAPPSKANPPLLFSPSDAGMSYESMKVKTGDGIELNGWLVSAKDTPANTIIIIHDLNESKLLYIDHLKQFNDRGFNVGIFDLRAHGSSGGVEFSPGLPSVEDARLFSDQVIRASSTKNLVFMGIGLGAAIALQASVYDERCQALVLQSPVSTYENYLDRYARLKWGSMKTIWHPIFKRKAEALLQYPMNELDLKQIAGYTTLPTLFVIGSDDEKNSTSETLQVLDASAAEKKELFLVRNAKSENIAIAGGEAYYNRIALFLNTNLPKSQKITRYKKLALNDH